METIWEGHIAGRFEGYEGGRIYELTDGSRWRQVDRTKEHVYRERAGDLQWPCTLVGRSGGFAKTANLSSSLGSLLKPPGLP
ncbi:hypothetical protein V5E97_12740 [Singulisphaera sp. Ch08]|uniref:Uncharacterized protein n=1 Tax=Singulisphaera sp. Ch08 TaxID=3120278 RepID=A0AAU7CPC5_9BACT